MRPKAPPTRSGAPAPAETALTSPARMALMRAASAAIRPALVEFYDALDQGQKVRFAGMS